MGRERCQQHQRRNSSQPTDAGQDRGLVSAPLKEILLTRQHDKERGIIRGGEKDTRNGIQHRVAGDHSEEEHRQVLRQQEFTECRSQEDDKTGDVINVKRRHQRKKGRQQNATEGTEQGYDEIHAP